jgi:type I restriction enzyme S subunit
MVINTGSVGEVVWSGVDFWSSDGTFVVETNKNIDDKFLYYFLKTREAFLKSQRREGGVPTIDRFVIEKIPIPIPPLPIQQEIVNILDKFTALEAELQAELEARRKQYEYYRQKLLNFSELENIVEGGVKPYKSGGYVEWKTLGEIGKFYGGLSGKNKDDFESAERNAKYIAYMNIFSNIKVNTNVDTFVLVKENEIQNKIIKGDILFTGSSETVDECGMSSVLTTEKNEDVYLNSFCFGLRLNDEYSTKILPDFSKFIFRSYAVRKQIIKTASGVTRYNISKKRMEKVSIPIPPLTEQERIVSILDKFEEMVNKSLPEEIEARRKQYEYYREKLLTFGTAGFPTR